MLVEPPDRLVLQTHSHHVSRHIGLLREVAACCDVRVHVSIETDRDVVDGLPPHATPVAARIEACGDLRRAGLCTVVTVSPLLPFADPAGFFRRLSDVADAVVIDHFIQGDGTPDGSRTRRTLLPAAMANLDPESVTLDYRDRIVDVARREFRGRVGVNIDGFAGRYLDAETEAVNTRLPEQTSGPGAASLS
jgi:DNA repair photolyase